MGTYIVVTLTLLLSVIPKYVILTWGSIIPSIFGWLIPAIVLDATLFGMTLHGFFEKSQQSR